MFVFLQTPDFFVRVVRGACRFVDEVCARTLPLPQVSVIVYFSSRSPAAMAGRGWGEVQFGQVNESGKARESLRAACVKRCQGLDNRDQVEDTCFKYVCPMDRSRNFRHR